MVTRFAWTQVLVSAMQPALQSWARTATGTMLALAPTMMAIAMSRGVIGYLLLRGAVGSSTRPMTIHSTVTGAYWNKHATAKNQLVWKWKSGADVPGGLFGNPLADGDQTLCVYGPAGLLTYVTAPTGGTCTTAPIP
jgi:hypothetical protein